MGECEKRVERLSECMRGACVRACVDGGARAEVDCDCCVGDARVAPRLESRRRRSRGPDASEPDLRAVWMNAWASGGAKLSLEIVFWWAVGTRNPSSEG